MSSIFCRLCSVWCLMKLLKVLLCDVLGLLMLIGICVLLSVCSVLGGLFLLSSGGICVVMCDYSCVNVSGLCVRNVIGWLIFSVVVLRNGKWCIDML